MLSFLTWASVTLLWADDPSAGMTILQMYVLRLIVFLILIPNLIRTKEHLGGLMNTLALNGWVLIVVSARTLLLEGYTPGTRFQVLGVNENAAGILALVTMSGVLWQAMQPVQQHKALRTLMASLFLLLAMGLVAMSGSRGSAISLLVAFLAFWFWKPTRRWGILGLLTLALGAISAPFVLSTTLERFAGMHGDTLLGGREAIWQGTWNLILNHFWRGVGIGNAPYAVLPYLRLLASVWGQDSAAIHNPVLAIWAETGLPGLLLYLSLVGSALWLFVKRYVRCRRSGARFLSPYFALVSCVFAGYMSSWIKGGGMESDYTYFLMLALLLIPSQLEDVAGLETSTQIDSNQVARSVPITAVLQPQLESPQ
jgi:O-antigen ligase